MARTRPHRASRVASARPIREQRVHATACSAHERAIVLARVNDARRSAHLRPLAADARLESVAQARARDMAAANRLSHSGWKQAMRGEDAVAAAMGENVAFNYPSGASVVDGWMRSSGHRANILGSAFRRMGVGCVVDGHAHLWWAQEFAD